MGRLIFFLRRCKKKALLSLLFLFGIVLLIQTKGALQFLFELVKQKPKNKKKDRTLTKILFLFLFL